MKTRKMIIIGGGLGGLATALRSAVHGWQVTVIERGEQIGGKMNRFEFKGFRFDTGPSLITLPSIFEELFATAGENLYDSCAFRQISPLAHYRFPDGTQFHYPAPLPQMLASIKSIEPQDIDGFWRYMKLGARLYELSKRTFFQRSPSEAPSLGDLNALKYMPLRFGWGNYAKTVAAHFRSPHLRQVFNRYPTYVGSSPYRTPATLSVIPYIEFAYGGWYVDGGLYSVISALEKLLIQRNVEIRTASSVVQILVSNKCITGVALENGDVINADVVVMNGDASTTSRLLNPDLKKVAPEEESFERSLSAVVFLVGMNKRIDALSHHSLLFSSDYVSEFQQLFEQRIIPDDPTIYINSPSRTDPTAAPAGSDSLFIMINAPAYNTAQWNNNMTEKVWIKTKNKLRQFGITIDEQDVAVREAWTPAKFEQEFGSLGGSIYGNASHSWKTTFFRPENRDRTIKGLYYVGGTSHPGGGTPMVLVSAKITSSLIERYEH